MVFLSTSSRPYSMRYIKRGKIFAMNNVLYDPFQSLKSMCFRNRALVFLCIGFQKKYIVLHTYSRRSSAKRKICAKMFFLSLSDRQRVVVYKLCYYYCYILLTLLFSEKPMRIRRNFASTAILSI